jgi:hypothetical protein
MILDTIRFEGDLGAAYFLMIIGAIGIILIGVYVILKILLYFRNKALESEKQG